MMCMFTSATCPHEGVWNVNGIGRGAVCDRESSAVSMITTDIPNDGRSTLLPHLMSNFNTEMINVQCTVCELLWSCETVKDSSGKETAMIFCQWETRSDLVLLLHGIKRKEKVAVGSRRPFVDLFISAFLWISFGRAQGEYIGQQEKLSYSHGFGQMVSPRNKLCN